MSHWIDEYGNSDLILAVENKQIENVKILLHYKTDVNHSNKFGLTALMLAVWYGYAKIAKILIDYGADVNHSDENGKTALMLATGRRGSMMLVRLLLIAGANVNAFDKNGNTALILAWKFGYTIIVKTLLRCGADVTRYQEYFTNRIPWRRDSCTHLILLHVYRKKSDTYFHNMPMDIINIIKELI